MTVTIAPGNRAQLHNDLDPPGAHVGHWVGFFEADWMQRHGSWEGNTYQVYDSEFCDEGSTDEEFICFDCDRKVLVLADTIDYC